MNIQAAIQTIQKQSLNTDKKSVKEVLKYLERNINYVSYKEITNIERDSDNDDMSVDKEGRLYIPPYMR